MTFVVLPGQQVILTKVKYRINQANVYIASHNIRKTLTKIVARFEFLVHNVNVFREVALCSVLLFV